VQLVSVSMKLRQMFYTQIERRTFHTAWTQCGSRPKGMVRPVVSNSGPIHPVRNIRLSSGGSDASWVDKAV
jgi:hypothetical protein